MNWNRLGEGGWRNFPFPGVREVKRIKQVSEGHLKGQSYWGSPKKGAKKGGKAYFSRGVATFKKEEKVGHNLGHGEGKVDKEGGALSIKKVGQSADGTQSRDRVAKKTTDSKG